jgi:hypothetical protein
MSDLTTLANQLDAVRNSGMAVLRNSGLESICRSAFACTLHSLFDWLSPACPKASNRSRSAWA